MAKNRITVFTKPWPDLTLEDLADLVVELGADGVELPVRDGYQVTPESISTMLPEAVAALGERGLVISSVAGSLEENTIRAMGESGIGILRVCIGIDMSKGYLASVDAVRQQIVSLEPVLRSAGVTVGIQNHYGHSVASALGILHLIDPIAPEIAGAVLDFAHCALDGEPPEMAADIVKERLSLVNFKNACRVRTNGPDEPEAAWEVLWTTARHGGYSWEQAVKVLGNLGYTGDLCLPGEYSLLGTPGQLMGDDVIPRLGADVAYLRQLLS